MKASQRRHPAARRALACLVLGACALLPLPACADARTTGQHLPVLRVVTDANFPPYTYLNAEGGTEGYLKDYWALWSRKTGIPVEFKPMRWSEAQTALQGGQADVIDLIYRTPPREPHYDFSPPYAQLPVGIYSHIDIQGIHNTATLKGFQIGVQAGDACIDQLQAAGISSLQTYPDYETMIRAALRRDIKVFCLDEGPAHFYLYKLSAEKQYRQAFVLYTGQAHRAVREGRTDLLELVQHGAQAISADEEAALRERWLQPSDDFALPNEVWWGAGAVVGAGVLLLLWNLLLRRRVAARTADLRRALEGLRAAHGETEQARADLAATLQAIPDWLFEVDADGQCVKVYAGSEDNAADLRHASGAKLGAQWPTAAAETVRAAVQQALNTGRDSGRRIRIAPTGNERWFELSCTRKAHGRDARVLVLARDITQRLQAETEAQRARDAQVTAERERLFQVFYEMAPVAMAFQRGGQVESVNQKYLSLLGLTADDIQDPNRWFERAYPDPDYRAWVVRQWTEDIEQARRGSGVVEARQYHVNTPSGRQLTLMIGGQLLDDGLLITLQDITPIKQAQQAAEAANEAKSAFLATMSHEIRTPLNAIIGLTTLLLRGDATAAQRDRLQKIEGAGQQLLGTINDILDFSKIEAGKMDIECRPFDLREQLRQVQWTLEDRAQAKGLQLHVHVDIDVPDTLLGDPQRIGQVLLNLGGNAIKFTPSGRIDLRARVNQDAQGTPWVRLEVEDTGIGIAAAEQGRLFQRFQQADNSTTRRFGGTGLGLAISRRLVELMGGHIGLVSEEGRGSTFWLEWPLRTPDSETPRPVDAPERAHSPLPDTRAIVGRRILLVEDNPLNQELGQELLRLLGVDVLTADNGRIAVSMVERERVDLVLMDMQMPEMDGLEATRRIRLLPGHRDTPILAMTANASVDDRRRCIDAGMNDHLAKPIDLIKLAQVLLRYLVSDVRQPPAG